MRSSTCLLSIISFVTGLSLQAQQWPGYTLYSNGNATTAYLIDTNNAVIKTWSGLTGGTGYSSYLAPGGTLVRSVKETNAVFTGGGSSGGVQKVDYNGNLVWSYSYNSSTYYSHHDHCPMPNGNVLLIAWELKNQAAIAAAGCTSTITAMWPDHIVEVMPTGVNTGSIVWEWHAWDHLVQNVDNTKANYQTSIVNHPELLNINYMSSKDWMHCNGIDYNPMLDQVILSSHNLNEYYIIDHSTTTAEAAGHTGGKAGRGGDILYRWGNPQAYGATGTKYFNVVHDAHWIPEGHPNAGRTVGFNNQGISPSQSCVDEIMPPRQDYNYTITLGSAFTPSIYAQRTTGFGYTSNEGSSEQLPNGNQLVCTAIPGLIFETNPSGTPIFTISTGAKSSQAHRYSPCYVNNPAPAQPSITLNGGQLSSTSANTYQWYVNGNAIPGATLQNHTPTQSGYYIVRTTDSNGCVYVYSSSVSFILSLKENVAENIGLIVSPNPGDGVFDIHAKYISIQKLELMVYDELGRKVYADSDRSHIDLSHLPPGIYILDLKINETIKTNKKVIITR